MFTSHDSGCHGDGNLGHSHIRARMADILSQLYKHHPRGGKGIHWKEVGIVVEALLHDMSDDACEEVEAIEWLNKCCDDSCYFEMADGDLYLMERDHKEEYMNSTDPLCQYCKEPQESVRTRRDPFEYEIYHSDVEVDICDKCYRSQAMRV